MKRIGCEPEKRSKPKQRRMYWNYSKKLTLIINSHLIIIISEPASSRNSEKNIYENQGDNTMASSNKKLVPEAKEALNRFKMEAANEKDVPSPS